MMNIKNRLDIDCILQFGLGTDRRNTLCQIYFFFVNAANNKLVFPISIAKIIVFHSNPVCPHLWIYILFMQQYLVLQSGLPESDVLLKEQFLLQQ